jgi:hypothetical protein
MREGGDVMNVKNYLIVTMLSVMVLALMFIPFSGSQTTPQYDPWIDINDDGKIDIRDYQIVKINIPSTGDPTKNVNVTNWPIATNYLTVMLNVTAAGATIPVGLLSANETANIGGKSVTFTGGGVSGGVSFSSYQQYYSLGGGCLGSGRIEVYDTTGSLLASFALPLNSMFTVNKVGTITVYAEVTVPYLGVYGQYYAFVVASVFWIQN